MYTEANVNISRPGIASIAAKYLPVDLYDGILK